MNEVEEIKKRLSIEEVVGAYLDLKKSGSGLTALCPFHNEKTPSFHVSPEKGIYKCFGCGESGDIFSFIEKYEAVDFPTALKKLADLAGVKLNKINSKKRKEDRDQKEKYFHILEDITTFWQKELLKNEEVKSYLKKRGVNEKMVRKFRLGFAPHGWQTSLDFLKSHNFIEADIETVGLIKKSENNNSRYYDRFRNRIIFPLFDEQDRVIAFSGRDFSGSEKVAKYLNSPQTILFDKSAVLYGFNFAKTVARKRDYFILTEGQMDLIMSHQVGFENTVATSGTSLTDQHLKLLRRFSENIIFSFDADEAGLEASFKGIKKALSFGFEVKILDLDKGTDPADLILKDKKKWIKIVKNSQNVILFYIKKILKKDSTFRQKNREMVEKVLPLLLEVQSPIEKGHYISKIATGFDITIESVEEELEKVREKIIKQEEENLKKEFFDNSVKKGFEILSKSSIISKKKKKILKELTAIYYWQKGLEKSRQWIAEAKVLETIKQSYSEEILDKIINLNKKYQDVLILDMEYFYADRSKEGFLQDFEALKENLENTVIREQRDQLQKDLGNTSNDDEKQEILKKIKELNKKI